LGTSTSAEAKEYFSDLRKHKIEFQYTGPENDSDIVLAFDRKKADARKVWLSNMDHDNTFIDTSRGYIN
jgi:DNA topoisomerase-2